MSQAVAPQPLSHLPRRPGRWMRVFEAAAHARVHPRTIRRWMAQALLTPYRPGAGGVTLIDQGELDALLLASAEVPGQADAEAGEGEAAGRLR